MKPDKSGYNIVCDNGSYKTYHIYNLMTQPMYCATWSTLELAKEHCERMLSRDLNNYERLKAMGRSFPANG